MLTSKSLFIFCSFHLKRGGYIVVCDAIGKSSYTVGNNTFRVPLLSKTAIKDIFSDNRFEIKEWTGASITEISTLFKCFCMLARKK